MALKDKRLLTCASLCVNGRAADVGTDHGYLPIYLVSEGICSGCIACDINEAPLASAKENILAAGLSDKIETVLSDGLDSVPQEGISNVIIAGMGGELIADIISRAGWLRSGQVNLVLQPMTKWDHLRKYLYDNGFEVLDEKACSEGKFVYSVIRAVWTGKTPDFPCGLCYLYGGKVSPDTDDGRAYLLRQAQRLEAVGKGLAASPEKAEESRQYLAAAEVLRMRAGT